MFAKNALPYMFARWLDNFHVMSTSLWCPSAHFSARWLTAQFCDLGCLGSHSTPFGGRDDSASATGGFAFGFATFATARYRSIVIGGRSRRSNPQSTYQPSKFTLNRIQYRCKHLNLKQQQKQQQRRRNTTIEPQH